MTNLMKRRQFLLSGLVLGAGAVTLVALGPGLLTSEEAGLPEFDGHTRREALNALARYGDRDLGLALARAGIGTGLSADNLLEAIWDRATSHGWSPDAKSSDKALRKALQVASKKDFEAGRIVSFEGFVLSQTES